MEDFRLIANPQLLANNKRSIKTSITYFDKLKGLLTEEYHDIYLSDKIIHSIINHINKEINNIMIDRIIEECLDACIEEVINLNKFDFCIPFE